VTIPSFIVGKILSLFVGDTGVLLGIDLDGEMTTIQILVYKEIFLYVFTWLIFS
jgi:hypothetical protein